MKLIEAECNLVIAGSWNPAILTPNWIGQNALGLPKDKDFKVQLQVAVQAFGSLPRFAFEDITLQAMPDALVFALDTNRPDQVSKTVHVAQKILGLLTHTPVTGVGINLSYVLEDAAGPLAATFKAGADIAALIGEQNDALLQQQHKLSVRLADHILNASVGKVGQEVRLGLNHHFDCNSATKAAAILANEQLFTSLRALSEKLAQGLEAKNGQ